MLYLAGAEYKNFNFFLGPRPTLACPPCSVGRVQGSYRVGVGSSPWWVLDVDAAAAWHEVLYILCQFVWAVAAAYW